MPTALSEREGHRTFLALCERLCLFSAAVRYAASTILSGPYCSVKYCGSGVGLRPDGTPNIRCPLSRRQTSSILTSRLLTLKSGIGMASPVSAAVRNRAFSCEHTSATCSAWPAWWRAQHPVYCVGDLPYHRKVHK